MKVPLSWLHEFLKVSLSVEEICEKLTLLGIEVEKVQKQTFSFEGVVVGRVLQVSRHPHADRLQIARVDDGLKTYQVVCGAANCREGLVTAFARIGAVLHDPLGKQWKIKPAKIRDVESEGMLCSSEELGLSASSDGIVELPSDLTVGLDVTSFFADTVLDISLTPNLGHCLSITGIARELSAALDTPLIAPTLSYKHHAGGRKFDVVVKDLSACPRFTYSIIENVSIGPSPDWLVKKLDLCGIRSINNIVDITNYVMLETGQPLHAYDVDKIRGEKIYVDSARLEVPAITLDQKARIIPTGTLVISDEESPLSIAGVMGCLSSSVTSETKNILIESASFHPSLIRKAAKKMDLRSESSYRFERGTDPQAPPASLARACQLIAELMPEARVFEAVDTQKEPLEKRQIDLRPRRLNQTLGTNISNNEIVSILRRLEMQAEPNSEESLRVFIPSYRNDVRIEVDLIEDVARVFGYNNLPKKIPRHTSSQMYDCPMYLFEKQMRRALLQEGLQECITCDLIGPELSNLCADAKEDSVISVLHPSSVDQSLLRHSLLPGLLQTLMHNHKHLAPSVSVFEIGKIHFKEGFEFKEHTCAGILLSGKHRAPHWDSKPADVDFYDLKGIVQNVFDLLKIPKVIFRTSSLTPLHPGKQAEIIVDGVVCGVIGEVHPQVLLKMDYPVKAFFAQINLEEMLLFKKNGLSTKELPMYPASERDWTVSLKDEASFQDVFSSIEEVATGLLESYTLLDVYKNAEACKERKNLTIRFTYRDSKKTLDIESVEKEHQNLIHSVAKKLSHCII